MVIAHLYSDLLNLYGNDGNVKILVKNLNELGIKTEVLSLSIGDKLDFSKYDLVYMGSGIEDNLKLVIKDLKKYTLDIKKAVADNKLFLITGNAVDIFGEKLVNEKEEISGIKVFNYYSLYVDRIKKDVVYNCEFLKRPILGFENHNYVLENNYNYLFEDTGVKVNNFYGTYVEGPILVRNPEFLKYFISLMIKDKKKVKQLDLKLEEKAYENFSILLSGLK